MNANIIDGNYEIPDATCMICGKECKEVELIYTGDDESYLGYELWCYCDKCNIDTFHKIEKSNE